MGVEKTAVMDISKQPCPIQIMIDKKKNGMCGKFQLFGQHGNNDARCIRKIKSRITIIKVAFTKKKDLQTSKLGLNIKNKTEKYYIRSIASYDAETVTLRIVDQSHVESLEMQCWRRIEKIHGTDLMRNAEVLQRVKKERSMLQTTEKNGANWIGHILCRNCLFKTCY